MMDECVCVYVCVCVFKMHLPDPPSTSVQASFVQLHLSKFFLSVAPLLTWLQVFLPIVVPLSPHRPPPTLSPPPSRPHPHTRLLPHSCTDQSKTTCACFYPRALMADRSA